MDALYREKHKLRNLLEVKETLERRENKLKYCIVVASKLVLISLKFNILVVSVYVI
jgi:hypothetical protein